MPIRPDLLFALFSKYNQVCTEITETISILALTANESWMMLAQKLGSGIARCRYRRANAHRQLAKCIHVEMFHTAR